MKLGLVVEAWEPQIAGLGRSVAHLAQGLCRLGHQVTVVAGRAMALDPSEQPVRLVIWPHRFAIQSAKVNAFARWASIQLSQERFDRTITFTPLVSAHVLYAWGGTVRSAVRRDIARRNNLLSRCIAGGWSLIQPRRQLLLAMEKRTVQNSDWSRLLVVSEMAAEEYVRDYQVDRRKICVVPGAAQVQAMDEQEAVQARRTVREGFGLGADDLTYVFLSRHAQRDGVKPLLKALGQLRQQGVAASLLLAGGAEYEQQRQAAAWGVRPWVKMVGATQQTGPLLCAADVLVLPTRYDVGSQAVLDAVAMGVPVIGSEKDGSIQRWMQADGLALGRILRDGWDVSALTGAMSQLADPQARAACRLAALQVREQIQFQTRLERIEAALSSDNPA